VTIPLLNPEQRWECPNCPQTHVTNDARPHTPFHDCRGLKGLTAPFVTAGRKVKVEALEREDYVGNEMVQVDGDGRPVMSVQTTHDDGTDLAVLAPCATLNATAHQ
jgi:hypothetical protein